MRKSLFHKVACLLLTGIMASGITTGCTRGASGVKDAGERARQIEDSLYTGHYAFVGNHLPEVKREALALNDSDLWARLMVKQSVYGYYTCNPPLLLASADSAISWLQRHHPDTARIALLAKAYQSRGAYFDQFNYNPDSTLKYQRLSIGLLRRLPATANLVVSYGNFANTMRFCGRLDSATYYYKLAISMADSLGVAPPDYISLYNGLASVMTDLRDFDNSEVWWQKSLSLMGYMSPFDKFNTLTGIGNDYYYRKDYKDSNATFLRLDAYLDSLPSARWEKMFTAVNLADTYMRLGNVAEAGERLDSAQRYFTVEQPNPVCLSYIHTLKMREAWMRGDKGEVERLIREHPVADTLRPEQLLARHELLSDYYAHSGRPEKALASYLKYAELTDSMRSERVKQNISALSASYRHDSELLTLKAENSAQKSRSLLLLSIVAGCVAALLAILVGVVIYRGRQQKRERRMMDKIIGLRNENLRNRITPHFIYNALNHAIHCQGETSGKGLDAIVRLLHHQQKVASEILVPLSDELSFVDDYVSVMSAAAKGEMVYDCIIDDGIDPAAVMFPSMMLQILVENAFKHGFPTLKAGEAKILRITVRKTGDDRMEVGVFNNRGAGEQAPYDSRHSGLHIITETVRLINERRGCNCRLSIVPDAREGESSGYLATLNLPLTLNHV